MSLPTLLDAFIALPAFTRLSTGLPGGGAQVGVSALPGSADAALVAALARRHSTRFFVVAAGAVTDAERWMADLESLAGAEGLALYPPREGFGELEPHAEVAGERVETVERLVRGQVRILCTTARALLERTRLPRALAELRLELRRGEQFRPEELAGKLEAMGFERVEMVEDVAQFAVRGGIFDIYSFGMAEPVRLEFWGDELSEIRHFDLATQRSLRAADVAVVLPVDGAVTGPVDESSRVSIAELWPSDTVLVIPEGAHLEPELERTWNEARHHVELARRRGEAAPDRADLFLAPAVLREVMARASRVVIEPAGTAGAIAFPLRAPEAIDRDIARLKRVVADGVPTMILCDNTGQAERLEELLSDGFGGVTAAALVIGVLGGGFVLPPAEGRAGLRVLTDHEVFRRERRLRRARRIIPTARGNGSWSRASCSRTRPTR